MMERKINFIIAEGLDVHFFQKKEDAEVALEAIDVSQGVYRGYDATGNVLQIKTTNDDAPIWKQRVQILTTDLSAKAELVNLLRDFLERIGRDPKTTDLNRLLAECSIYAE